jgi:LysM repeat protein
MYVRNRASHPVLPAEHRMQKFTYQQASTTTGSTTTRATGEAMMSDTATVQATAAVPRLRLTRRGRVVFTALAATPLVIVALAFALNGGMATATAEAGSTEYVTVLAGQSLWQLAEEVAPGEDTREVVAQLLRANSLDSAEVFPGQQLAVPNQYRS